MWYRNKVKVLKKTEVLNWKLAKCFLVFMMCISIEILGRFSEDVYVKGDKYILVKTKHPGRIDRRQKTVFRFRYIQQVWPSKKWTWAKDSNIALHFSVVRCFELNCSLYSTDSSNRKRNTFSYQNFSLISENTSSSLGLIYRIKNNLKLLQRFFSVYC